MVRRKGVVPLFKVAVITMFTKSPRPKKGRIGPIEKQDWYKSCVLAAKLLAELEHKYLDVRIVIPTDVVIDGEHEGKIYREVLVELGVCLKKITIVPHGHETIGQADYLIEHVVDHNHSKNATATSHKVVVISTWTHSWRVKYLMRKAKYKHLVEHYTAWGRPRPREAVTDAVLTVLFPIIELVGLCSWFQKWITRRRQDNKL